MTFQERAESGGPVRRWIDRIKRPTWLRLPAVVSRRLCLGAAGVCLAVGVLATAHRPICRRHEVARPRPAGKPEPLAWKGKASVRWTGSLPAPSKHRSRTSTAREPSPTGQDREPGRRRLDARGRLLPDRALVRFGS